MGRARKRPLKTNEPETHVAQTGTVASTSSSSSGTAGSSKGTVGVGHLRDTGPKKRRTAKNAAPAEEAKVTPLSSLKVLTNPMLLSKIATSLSRPLHRHDLKILRQTSKEWNTAMIPKLMSQEIIRFDLSKHPGSVTKFTNDMKKSTKIPFGAIQLKYDSYTVEPEKRRVYLQEKKFQDLFATCGPVLTKLDLSLEGCWIDGLRNALSTQMPVLAELLLNISDASYKSTETKRQIINKKAVVPKIKLPALKVLKFKNDSNDTDFIEYIKPIMAECITGATSLQYLSFGDQDWRHHNFDLHILNLLKDAPCQKSVRVLKMKLVKLRAQTLEALIGLKELKLSTFGIKLESIENQASADMLNQFFVAQSTYLKNLSIKHDQIFQDEDAASKYKLSVPELLFLETFKLNLSHDANFTIQLLPGSFTRLEKLSFYEFTGFRDQQVPGTWPQLMPLLSSPTITELNFYECSTEQLEELVRHFPAVIKLSVSVNGDVLPQLWTAWPDLEELHVHFTQSMNQESTSVDGLITGIPEAEINILRERTRLRTRSQKPASDLIPNSLLKTAPGITDLQQLRVFHMKYSNSYKIPKQCVTDISGYMAFASPGSKLRKIILKRGGVRISERCKATMQEALGPDADLQIGPWEPDQEPRGCYCCWASQNKITTYLDEDDDDDDF